MMGAWTGCLIVLCGQALSMEEKSLIDTAWTAILAHEHYVRQHRGYLAYLDTHADIASAEEAWIAIQNPGEFRAELKIFEEAILGDETVRRTWDRYTETLVRDDILRAKEDAWCRAVLASEIVRTHGCAGVFWLQSHAGDALRFFENPARPVSVPELFYPLRTWLAGHPRVRDEWRDAFRKLYECTAAHDSVFPWWNMGAPEYQQLFARLARRPPDFWAWRRQALAWAVEPRARDWARYWRGCVRRDPVLSDRYAAYVLFLRERPAWRDAADRAWEAKFGPVPAWPPVGDPPALEPVESPKRPVVPRKEPDSGPPHRPDKPGVTMPSMPSMPEKPKLKEPADSRFKRQEFETPRPAAPQ
ncbi:MAG TPA: hypothetical protein P5318_10845 [Candidatus Hydrogenedentes bacterium]|nr:hypothetical protein [Candidatus Hydrogenedentota bacterium]HRT20610.1 hypothetical protein [Candidatus Hydrogenedentota bacterium]HRT65383.1 hypothetical protein [Candidatus Hydrogenedentota bacterium]